MRYKKTLLAGTAVLLGLVVAIPQALAVPMLKLSTSGGASVMITDNGAGDLSPTPGVVTFLGSLGSFALNMTTGLTKPFLGNENLPILDIQSFNATSTVLGEVLTIEFSENGFTGLHSGVVGELTGHAISGDFKVTYEGLIDVNNMKFSGSSLGLSNAPGIDQAFSSGIAGTTNPYALTQIITLEATSTSGALNMAIVSIDASIIATPEPGAILLFGSGLVGLGVWRLRKSQT